MCLYSQSICHSRGLFPIFRYTTAAHARSRQSTCRTSRAHAFTVVGLSSSSDAPREPAPICAGHFLGRCKFHDRSHNRQPPTAPSPPPAQYTHDTHTNRHKHLIVDGPVSARARGVRCADTLVLFLYLMCIYILSCLMYKCMLRTTHRSCGVEMWHVVCVWMALFASAFDGLKSKTFAPSGVLRTRGILIQHTLMCCLCVC